MRQLRYFLSREKDRLRQLVKAEGNSFGFPRFEANKAKLIISDCASETEPGGPIGQETMFNFIEIQPYLED